MWKGKGLNKLSTAVVGLGQVGQGYDYDSPDDSVILTHSTALYYHHRFDLIAAVDSDPAQCERFEKKFSKPTYPDLGTLQQNHNPEIIALAIPTELHFSAFNDALALHPIGIVCEKPVATNVKKARMMIDAAKTSNCAVCVNYIRRFNPAIVKLKRITDTFKLGEIYKSTVWYTKGIQENGSHFIDLLCYLLGEVQSVRVLQAGRKWNNYDPEPDLLIRFGDTDVYMLAGREEYYSLGQFELIGTNGLVWYYDGDPVTVKFAQKDPVYDGYRNLGNPETIENPGEKNIWFTYDNLARHLDKGVGIKSTLETATSTLQIVEEIISQLENA